MPNVKVTPRLYSHPATLRAGNAAIGLWIRSLTWLAEFPEEEGFVPDYIARTFGTRGQISALVKSGLWDEEDGGFRPHSAGDIGGSGRADPLWSIERTEQRAAIPDRVRRQIYERDGYACLYCGATDRLSLDHIYPRSKGGGDEPSNLQTLCMPCNVAKGVKV